MNYINFPDLLSSLNILPSGGVGLTVGLVVGLMVVVEVEVVSDFVVEPKN